MPACRAAVGCRRVHAGAGDVRAVRWHARRSIRAQAHVPRRIDVFTFGSLLCGIAPSIAALIGSRALQGVGAAILLPSTLAILAPAFPDPRDRARRSDRAGVSGTALGAGPLIGGCSSTRVLAQRVLHQRPDRNRRVRHRHPHTPRIARCGRRLDLPGQLTAILARRLTYALIDGEARGWTSPLIVGSFVLGISAIVAFIMIELHVRQPMLQLQLFRSRTFASADVSAPDAHARVGARA